MGHSITADRDNPENRFQLDQSISSAA